MSRWIAPMLVAAALAVGWPLLLPWSYETREGGGAAYEAAQLGAAVHDGQIPVRWLPDLDGGRGLPVFVYASPLAFYAIALVHATGLGVLVSTKTVLLLALALSPLAMFSWLRTHASPEAAAVGAVAYGAAPVAATIVHELGDPAVVLAYALAPFVLLGAGRAAAGTKRGVAWLAASAAAVTLTDARAALALLPLVAAYGASLTPAPFDGRAPARVLSGIALGGLLSVFQWGPAWAERDLVGAASAPAPFGAWRLIRLAAVPAALLVAGFALGRSRARWAPALGAGCLVLAFAVDPVRPLLCAALVAAAVAGAAAASGFTGLRLLLLALSVAPALVTAAFALARRDPLLGLLAAGQAAAAAVAIAAATLDERILTRGPPAIAGLLIALVLPWSALPIRSALTGEPPVAALRERDLEREQVRRSGGLTRPSEGAQPRSVAGGTTGPASNAGPAAPFEVRGGSLDVALRSRSAKGLVLDVGSETGGILALELHDFPGWELTLAGPPDGRPEEVAHGSDRAGRIAVSVPPGSWRLTARWSETPLRRRCDEASGAGALILSVLFVAGSVRRPRATIRRRRD